MFNVYHPQKHFSNFTHEMTVKARRTFLAQSRKDRFVISGQKWPKEPNADKMKEKILKRGKSSDYIVTCLKRSPR